MAYVQTREQKLMGLAWGLLACIKIAESAGLTRADLIAVIKGFK